MLLGAIICVMVVVLGMYGLIQWLEYSNTLYNIRDISGVESSEYRDAILLPYVASAGYPRGRFLYNYYKIRWGFGSPKTP